MKHLFALAREKAPSIIFIDEIDGLMAARNDSASQTSIQMLNQFLMEMDGVKRFIFISLSPLFPQPPSNNLSSSSKTQWWTSPCLGSH